MQYATTTIAMDGHTMSTELSYGAYPHISTFSLNERCALVASLIKKKEWHDYGFDALSETAIENKHHFMALLEGRLSDEQFALYIKTWMWEYFKDIVEGDIERKELLREIEEEVNGYP